MAPIRAFEWWALAEGILGRLTAPRTDIAASDRQVEQLFRESSLFGFAQAAGGAIHRAWLDSRVRAIVSSRAPDVFAPDGGIRLRLIGIIVAAAFLTVLALHALGGRPS